MAVKSESVPGLVLAVKVPGVGVSQSCKAGQWECCRMANAGNLGCSGGERAKFTVAGIHRGAGSCTGLVHNVFFQPVINLLGLLPL